MNPVWKLFVSYIRHHPARMALTCLATMASACMVVWVVSGYDSLLQQFKEFSGVSMGRYTLMLYPSRSAVPRMPTGPGGFTPPGSPGTPGAGTRPTGSPTLPGAFQQPSIPPELVQQLRNDPDVAVVDAMWGSPAMVRPYDPATFNTTRPSMMPPTRPSAAGPNLGGPRGRGGVTLIGTDSPQPPFALAKGRWIDPKSTALEGVLSVDASKRIDVDVGGEIAAGIGENARKITVVGLVDTPPLPAGGRVHLRGPASGGLYVSLPVAAQIFNRPEQINTLGLILRAGADVHKFRFSWQPRLDRANPPQQFQNAQELEDELDSSQTARNMLMQAYSATGISLLAALFIIFATLSMGVSERARQFAILRAVVLTRWQVATLVSMESLLMAIVGWLGGLLAGFALLWIVQQAHPFLDTEIVDNLTYTSGLLGKWSVILSAACAFGGALCAAIVPAVRAMRLRPLDAIAPAPVDPSRRNLLLPTGAGLLLIAVNPLVTYVIPMADTGSRYALYMAVGCVSMAIGFILLAPLFVHLADLVLSPVLCAVLGLERRLVKSQLSSNLWRTVGASVALTIGLGLFVSIQIWGYTMLRPFEPGSWNPDAMIAFLPNGLPPSANDAVAHLPGLKPDSCVPLAVEQAKLTDDVTGSETRASVVRQDNIILIGLDPDRGLGGNNPLLKLDWVQGSPQSAVPLIKKGRHCIVPDHFCRESGLKLGDSFRLNPATDNANPIIYTIAGVVRLPGWHWISKFSGLRLNSGRSAAMAFSSYDSVASDFKLTNVRFYWTNATGPVDVPRLTEQAINLAQHQTDMPFLPAGKGFPSADGGNTVRITTPVDITQRIRSRASGWIWSMSQLPLVTLTVASLGVLNAIMASVRARRWEIGVMRSLGFTRWTITRAILAESVLIGSVACLLSLAFGILAGWCGTGISQFVSFFGGLHPGLVIPWSKLSIGLGGAIVLCLLAALWPAISVGRSEPLRLLQEGRSAM